MERTNYLCEARDVAQLAERLSGTYAALGSISRTAQVDVVVHTYTATTYKVETPLPLHQM